MSIVIKCDRCKENIETHPYKITFLAGLGITWDLCPKCAVELRHFMDMNVEDEEKDDACYYCKHRDDENIETSCVFCVHHAPLCSDLFEPYEGNTGEFFNDDHSISIKLSPDDLNLKHTEVNNDI